MQRYNARLPKQEPVPAPVAAPPASAPLFSEFMAEKEHHHDEAPSPVQEATTPDQKLPNCRAIEVPRRGFSPERMRDLQQQWGANVTIVNPHGKKGFLVHTIHGDLTADRGQFIVHYDSGSWDVWDPILFQKAYEIAK